MSEREESIREPAKAWLTYTHEDGSKVLDFHLIDPASDRVLAVVYSLEPLDVLRGILAHQTQPGISLEDYVAAVASTLALPLPSNETTLPIH